MTVLTRNEGLHAIETASRDEIAGLQLERMKWSVRHAYENSPFYAKRFHEHGVHPDDLRTLADLAKFPFTVKQDLRDTYPFGMFAVPREKLSRIHGSSLRPRRSICPSLAFLFCFFASLQTFLSSPSIASKASSGMPFARSAGVVPKSEFPHWICASKKFSGRPGSSASIHSATLHSSTAIGFRSTP